MQLVELTSAAEFAGIFPLIKQQNPTMTKAIFARRLKAMRAQGYRCVAAIDKGAYIGVAGFWEGTRFWCGRFIDFDNVVVDARARKKGVGARLIAWVEKEAKRLECDVTGLDCYATSHDAHRFYLSHGYIIKGYHLIKPLPKTEI